MRCKMSSKLRWFHSSKSATFSHFIWFSASNQAFEPHSYPQIKMLSLIPQHLPLKLSKSQQKSIFATYMRDFLTKMSSILKEMSARTACAACSFFQLWFGMGYLPTTPTYIWWHKWSQPFLSLITIDYCDILTLLNPLSMYIFFVIYLLQHFVNI